MVASGWLAWTRSGRMTGCAATICGLYVSHLPARPPASLWFSRDRAGALRPAYNSDRSILRYVPALAHGNTCRRPTVAGE